MSETPRYTHDCDSCVFLGRWSRYDLYFADHGGLPNTVIARFGSDGPEYTSGLPLAELDPALLMAKLRAQQLGLLPCDLPGCDQLRQQLELAVRERDEAREMDRVGQGLVGSFFGALKPLKLTALNVHNPGAHVTDLIADRDALRQRVAELEAALRYYAENWPTSIGLTAKRALATPATPSGQTCRHGLPLAGPCPECDSVFCTTAALATPAPDGKEQS